MHPQITELLVTAAPLALITAFVIWKWRLRAKSRDDRGRVPAVTDPLGRAIPGSTTTEHSVDGVTYQLERHLGTDDIPPFRVLTVLGTHDCEFLIGSAQPKNGFMKWQKDRQITFVKSGDHEFDNRVDVTTQKSPGYVGSCLQRPEFRSAALSLFDKGFVYLRCDGKGIDAVQGQTVIQQHVNQNQVTEEQFDAFVPDAINDLNTIAVEAGAAKQGRRVRLIPERRAFQFSLLLPVVCVMVAVAYIAGMFFLDGKKHVGPHSLMLETAIALTISAVWIPLSFRLLRGRAGLINNMVVVTIFTLAATWMTVGLLMIHANVYFDNAESTHRVRPIVATREHPGLDRGVDVAVASWYPDRDVEEIFLHSSDLATLTVPIDEANVIEIETKPGFFGNEWIVTLDTK